MSRFGRTYRAAASVRDERRAVALVVRLWALVALGAAVSAALGPPVPGDAAGRDPVAQPGPASRDLDPATCRQSCRDGGYEAVTTPPASADWEQSLQQPAAVRVFLERRAYPTNSDVTVRAVADVPEGAAQYVWHFGDSVPIRTTSKKITKRFQKPGIFSVWVVLSTGLTSVTSEELPLVVQRAVRVNRLIHQPSVLRNHAVTVSCRVNAGTNLTFLWDFGDGTSRVGQSSEQHVFHRVGEFRMEVTVSNLISSASLNSQIFVVDRPCRPPLVKNMGPATLQVQRHEEVRLGVTYEADLDCDLSEGLRYTWTLYDPSGQVVPLPGVETHRHSLTLPGLLLQHHTYSAIARVEVVDSIVYSNYSVRVQVLPSPPVAFIQGGTNIFINRRSTNTITLDAQGSHDPDFPSRAVSHSWRCEPVSSISSSCFDRHVPTSSSVLTFPATLLKQSFDQFRFTLTVHSGQRSSSSEAFLTVTPNLIGTLLVDCVQCRVGGVNWDQTFSVSAVCEGCAVSPELLQYTWGLFLVNASSKPSWEVVLGTPSRIMAGSGLPPAVTDSSQVSFWTTADSSDPTTTTNPLSRGPPPTPQGRHNRGVSRISSRSRQEAARSIATLVTGSIQTQETNRFNQTHHETSSLDLTVSVSTPQNASGPAKAELLSKTDVWSRDDGSGDEHDSPLVVEWDPAEPPLALSVDPPHIHHNEGIPHSDAFVIGRPPIESDPSSDWEFLEWESGEEGDGRSEGKGGGGGGGGREHDRWRDDFLVDLDDDDALVVAEEGDPGVSPGRPTGVDGEMRSPDGDSVLHQALIEDEGSDLMDSRPRLVSRPQTLLDLPRDPVDSTVFQSYTLTGISSSLLSFRPFSLRPGRRYMLEVTARRQSSPVGRNQFFFQTNEAPHGMRCQVQPEEGLELHTHFSIFCASGREDFLYTYSFSSGPKSRRTLYHGRDFQYYFVLPAGDPTDDYKVTVYTQVSSGLSGAATEPCAVTLRVRPSFVRDVSSRSSSSSSSLNDPDLQLSELGLRNLTALVRLRNAAEIRNYVNVLSEILNRLSQDAGGNTLAQKHLRNTLTRTMCELEIIDQVSMEDTIYLLKELLRVTNQITLASARRVTSRVQSISQRFAELGLHRLSLHTLVPLLSDVLRVAAAEARHASRIHPNQATAAARAGDEALQAASHLLLKYLNTSKTPELSISTAPVTLFARRHNQTETLVVTGDAATYSLPSSVSRRLLHRGREGAGSEGQPPCVLSVLTELRQNHYTPQLGRPVVELSLHTCTTRRKIHTGRLSPDSISTNISLKRNTINGTVAKEFVLLRSQVNYHSFNITQRDLQRAIQLSLAFTRPPNKTFPIMLLFRMFERPTPTLYHLLQIHRWENDNIHITLPPGHLNAAGVAHLALLSADFERPGGLRRLSSEVRYDLSGTSSLCLSWNVHQGAWTHLGCRTEQADGSSAVSCSCEELRPLTVQQQQILSSSSSTESLEPFMSVSTDLTVAVVLLLCVCVYTLMLVVCRRADLAAQHNLKVHYLPDNSPSDRHLYVVTVHTGLCSAANMSAKVYIVLYGEDGFSHTKELQAEVPGCTLFRRNSQDTFILSSADSLGPLWGIRLWHDNSGPSPDWYLKHVVVSEVRQQQPSGRHSWLFLGQRWLSVCEDDGRVDRVLKVSAQVPGFTELLALKLWDYVADCHLWVSVCRCPCPAAFTHTQRLSVCLLLLLGYSCVNTLLISEMDQQVPAQLGIIDPSAVSMATGLFSAAVVFPIVALISLLFRLQQVELIASGVHQTSSCWTEGDAEDAVSLSDSLLASHLSWGGLQQWVHEAWLKKYKDSDQVSVSPQSVDFKDLSEDQATRKDFLNTPRSHKHPLPISRDAGPLGGQPPHKVLQCQQRAPVSEWGDLIETLKNQDQVVQVKGQEDQDILVKLNSGLHPRRGGESTRWCPLVAWALCVALSLCCLLLSAVLGTRFSSSEVLLWTHSLFFSLLSCIFIIQPVTVLLVAVCVCFWYRNTADLLCSSIFARGEIETLHMGCAAKWPSSRPRRRAGVETELREARQRGRFLRLVCPPAAGELRRTRGKRRREALIHNTLRELLISVSMLILVVCVSCGDSCSDHHYLNKALRSHFAGGQQNSFLWVRKHQDWWKWAHSSLINALYRESSATTKPSHILIGQPVLWKSEVSSEGRYQSGVFTPPTAPSLCGQLGCHSRSRDVVHLGATRAEAASKLTLLLSDGWGGRQALALVVQVTVFSPAANMFSSVTLLAEQSLTGSLLVSAEVQSVRVYHTPAVRDYVVMFCQVCFLVSSLLQLYLQVHSVGQRGLMGYWRKPIKWLEASLLMVTLIYYFYYVYHGDVVMEVAEILQNGDNREQVDLSALANWQQRMRSLRGVMIFLLALKCAAGLRANRTLAGPVTIFARLLSALFWPLLSGALLLGALFCIGNLLAVQTSERGGPWSLVPWRDGFHSVGALRLGPSVAWAMLVITVGWAILKRERKPWSRRDVFTFAETASYIRQRVSVFFMGDTREGQTSTNQVDKTMFCLEEFESSVDELLFRLNALSDSLHHTLPPKAHRYIEDSPSMSPSQDPFDEDKQPDVRNPKDEVLQICCEGLSGPPYQGLDIPVRVQANSGLVFKRTLSHSANNEDYSVWMDEGACKGLGKLGTGNPLASPATHTQVVVEVLVHKEPEEHLDK